MTSSRRNFISSVGKSAALLPFLPSLFSVKGFGAVPSPKRLLVFVQNQGLLMDELISPGASSSDTDFTLGPILEPLAAHTDDMVFLTGISDLSNNLDSSYNAHTKFRLHTLTNQPMVWRAGSTGSFSPVSAGGPSIDQVIAQRLLGASPFRSVEAGVQKGENMGLTWTWDINKQMVPVENDPSALFDRLFGQFVNSDPAAFQAIKSRRSTILDALAGNINQLKPKLSSQDQIRLEQHLTSLNDLKYSVDNYPIPGEYCTAPTLTNVGNHLQEGNVPQVTKNQIDLLVSAFACDLTRVASLQIGSIQDWSFLDNVSFPEGWHDAVHAGPSTAANRVRLRTTYRWFMEQLSYLLTQLKAIPEGEGSLLDNTLVLYANIMSAGNHSSEKKCYMLAGGKNMGLQGGRHLSFDDYHHGALHTSILNLFGYEDDFFGHRDSGPQGPLPGLLL